MGEIVWTRVAQEDLESARIYLTETSPGSIPKILTQLRKTLKILSNHPFIGRPGRVKDTRELPLQKTPFILVYRVIESQIQILTFLHSSRRWP